MSTIEDGPDTIVLIHGFWVTPRSWEHWVTRYEARGYRVIRPRLSGLRGGGRGAEPESVVDRGCGGLTIPAIVEHLETVVGGLEAPPILMGHSAGGVFTQILLDHGFGAVGVAINSAPTEGVAVIGFALRWEGQEHGALWISGDTVLYDGVREVAERLRIGTASCTSGACASP